MWGERAICEVVAHVLHECPERTIIFGTRQDLTTYVLVELLVCFVNSVAVAASWLNVRLVGLRCRVSYEIVSLVAVLSESPLRLSLDVLEV